MSSSGRNTTHRTFFSAAVLMLLAAPAFSAPTNVVLTFGSLPSAQGFNYIAVGSDAGALESSVFSVSGGVLTQNSMARALGGAGGGTYYSMPGGVTPGAPLQIRFRARCLEATGPGGFTVGFSNSSLAFEMSLTPTQIFTLNSGGRAAAPGTFDNTQFHDYLFDWTPPSSYRVYRDGVQVDFRSGGFPSGANEVLIGDATGGANARGEFTSLEFIQDFTTPVAGMSWSRLKRLYR